MEEKTQSNTLPEEKSFKEKLWNFFRFKLFSSFRSKIVQAFAGSICALIIVIIVLPFTLNNVALKFQIAQKVSQITQASFVINGDVKISFLPTPSITINDAVLQNYSIKNQNFDQDKIYNIYAKSVEIKFPLLNFFAKSVVSKIIFNDAVVESYFSSSRPSFRENDFTNAVKQFEGVASQISSQDLDSNLGTKLFSIPNIDPARLSISTLPKIIARNSVAIFYDKIGRKKEVRDVKFEVKSTDKKITAKGSFDSESVISNFNLNANFNSNSSKPDSQLEVISPVMQLRVRGNFLSENKGIFASEFKGKIDLEILEFKSFYRSYINSVDVLASKLKYNSKPIKISADISNKAKETIISNLLINSELASGKGDLSINFSDKIPIIDVNFDLENFDLDSVISKEAVVIELPKDAAMPIINDRLIQEDNVEVKIEPKEKTQLLPVASVQDDILQNLTQDSAPSKNNSDLTNQDIKKDGKMSLNFAQRIRNFDLAVEIKIKNVRYFEGEIKDLSLYATVSRQGEILILPMIFKTAGEGMVRVNGVLDNSGVLPKFIGKFDAQGKSLKDVFKWLKIESQNLKFDSLKEYRIYSDIMLLPNNMALSNFYLNLNNSSEFLGELKIDSAGKVPTIVSRFHVSEFNIDDYFLTSEQNIYFSPGSLFKKLLWLNDITANGELNLSFDKMIYRQEEFPEQSIKLRFARGYFEIFDLNLRSEKTKLHANLVMDISDKNQRFEMNIDADNFHYETAQNKLIAGDEKNISGPKIKELEKLRNRTFFDQFYALPSLEGFGGAVSFNISNLKIGDAEIKKVKLSGKIKDGNIDDAVFYADLYDGTISYQGLIGIKINKTINGNFTFENASLQPLFTDLLGIKNISGVANISASVTSIASKSEEFKEKLSTELKFNAIAPTVAGYGLTDLVKKMFAPQNYAKELSNPEKILFNSTAVSVFNRASGTIQINEKKQGRLRFDITGPALNAILSGSVDLKTKSTDLLLNTIFLTGSRQKQTPINIASNIKGPFGNVMQSTNLDQVSQYLKPLGINVLLSNKSSAVRNIEHSKIISDQEMQLNEGNKKLDETTGRNVQMQEQFPINQQSPLP